MLFTPLKSLENEELMGNLFSRDFAEVIKGMLDDPTPAALLLANPFLRQREPTARQNLETTITADLDDIPWRYKGSGWFRLRFPGFALQGDTLERIIRSKFPRGIAVNAITLITGDILHALSDKSIFFVDPQSDRLDIRSRDIYIHTDPDHLPVTLQIDWRGSESDDVPDITGVGIIAMEMAFGSLPKDCNRSVLANHLRRILKLKLELKGENKGAIIIPSLEKLTNPHFVQMLEQKLLKRKKRNTPDKREAGKMKKIPTDFLEVVLMCLDEDKRDAKQILVHSFFRRQIYLKVFKISMS